jgi:signal transduction histidine kinase
MSELRGVTERNDHLVSEMNARAAALIALSDQARERQHASNADIIASMTEKDGRLRQARTIVDRAQDLRAAVLADRFERAVEIAMPVADLNQPAAPRARISAARLTSAANELARNLRENGRTSQADELTGLVRTYEAEGAVAPAIQTGSTGEKIATWIDRLVKVDASEERSLHDEVTQLLTYSVQAAETEQATQNIAIATLKLGRRTAEVLASRDVGRIPGLLDESRTLATSTASLPISPLIQSGMIDAIGAWRDRLATTGQGLGAQNAIMAAMGASSAAMLGGASGLNEVFATNAEKIGRSIRGILVFGAAIGLLLGSGTAYFVARSITRPLKSLQESMIELAADPSRGLLASSARRDELGAMARATNLFLREIGSREKALRSAKDQADAALAELRATQASLIQAEKLASLGQLVAGVAHEINTPLGVALTTSTTLTGEVQRLKAGTEAGRMLRSELTRIVDRLVEGSHLLLSNLNRAVDLIYSFKQVAADQASGERRRFEMKGWIHEVLTSLGPVLRNSGHQVQVECPSGLELDSYPGALAQVITNLVTNAKAHGYPDGRAGRLTLTISVPKPGTARIVFADDGRGIPPEHLARVFDPFFTTGRDRGNTGLGLHIVHNLVTLTLQGRIGIESEPGRGTRFTIDLPLSVAEAPSEPVPAMA